MMQHVDLRIANLDCEHDASRLRRGLAQTPGIEVVRITSSAAKVRLAFDAERTSRETVESRLAEIGFPVSAERGRPPAVRPWNNPKVITSVLAGLLLLLAWIASLLDLPEGLSTGGYLLAVLIGGFYFGREAIQDLLFERRIGIELLMGVAAIVAFALGQAGESAMLVFLYSISEALEGYTEEKTRSAIKALMDLTPKRATVRRDGRQIEIPVEELQVGDVFLVRPGEAVPTDGKVLSGRSSVNQAPVTGESVPVEKEAGSFVFAGSINGEGALDVCAEKTFAENTISRIIEMVEEAQEKKGQSQRFIERFGAWYSPAVLVIGVSLGILSPLLLDSEWLTALTRATVFIVAAAPCALVISIPITLVASLGTGARMGVLIKGGIHVEQLANVTVVALDKTGTITRGQPDVTDVVSGDDAAFPNNVLLSVAAAIEASSQHPLARAIVRRAEADGIASASVEDFRSITGAGATARYQGTIVYIGKPEFFERELHADLGQIAGTITRLQAEGKTVVLLGEKARAWGLIAVRDNVRANAREAVRALRDAGVKKVVMLTGDNALAARVIADEVGVNEVFADLKPEDKVTKVRELTDKHGRVAMVGDGVNDAPALAQAAVGVAMGAAGTDVALETADVALMADDLEKLVYALRLAKRTQKIVTQNLVLSVVVTAVLVVGALMGSFSLPVAVIGHELSELFVIVNGLRMLKS